MRTISKTALLVFGLMAGKIYAQDTVLFSLDDCISYALEHSTDIGRANNDIESQTSSLEQAKAERHPNLSFSASDSWSSSNSYNSSTESWNRSSASNVSFDLSSSVTLYNGAKIKNAISQGKIDLSAAETDIQTEKDLISLDILSAYINVMLAKETLYNTQAQLETMQQEMDEGEIKYEAGAMSPADYFNIKSQYASEKATLVEAKSNLRITLVTLMQLMNMPVTSDFNISQPDIESLINTQTDTDPTNIFQVALGIQPSVKSAELALESSEYDIKIAKGDALPSLILSGSLGTGYEGSSDINWAEQFSNKVAPSLSLGLSIPIYQRKEVKNSVKQAEITRENYEYNLIDIQNDLRKSIEQACTDADAANSSYESYQEQYLSEKEAYRLAEEMFSEGLLSSTDFITSKNNLLVAENELTQAKYNVILQNEIIEYYMGNEIGF